MMLDISCTPCNEPCVVHKFLMNDLFISSIRDESLYRDSDAGLL